MLSPNDNRTIQAKTDEVLYALRANLESHVELVKEAREGYLKKAEEALEQRLEQIRSGAVVDLTFRLIPPQDHSSSYRTVIRMLELHLSAGETTIPLKAADVQQYVLNDWTWMDSFLQINSTYSSKSRSLASEKGLV